MDIFVKKEDWLSEKSPGWLDLLRADSLPNVYIIFCNLVTNFKYFNLLESLILQVATTKALWCRVCLVHGQPEEVLRARLPLGRCQEVYLQEISIQF